MSKIVLSGIHIEQSEHGSRLTTDIEGAPVWFESCDLPLEANPESFATALVIPCLIKQVPLEIEQPVDSSWYANALSLMEFLEKNWGVPPIEISARTYDCGKEPVRQSAQFFSAGVDSFFTLFTAERPPDYLVFVAGFEFLGREHEEAILSHGKQCLYNACAHTGSRPCIVNTNIREHPFFDGQFTDGHGAMLAAVGHMLSPHIGSIIIAPSWHKAHPLVSGSNWQLPPLWSSKRLKVIAGDATLRRTERVARIAGERLVQENLRVCSSNKAPNRNCSRCSKCVRTMLDLHFAGKLEEFTVFDTSLPVHEVIDQLPAPSLNAPVLSLARYHAALERGLEPQLDASIRRLIERSKEFSSRVWEEAPKHRALIDRYGKLEKRLEATMRDYELLKQRLDRLSQDYASVVGNLPIGKSIRMLRRMIEQARGGGARTAEMTSINTCNESGAGRSSRNESANSGESEATPVSRCAASSTGDDSSTAKCSRCDACIRTMLRLHLNSALSDRTGFDTSNPVWKLIEDIPYVMDTSDFARALEHELEPELHYALRRLMRRSHVKDRTVRAAEVAYQRQKANIENMEKGLENALYHYERLQSEFAELEADYLKIVSRKPFRPCIEAVRHSLRLVRGR